MAVSAAVMEGTMIRFLFPVLLLSLALIMSWTHVRNLLNVCRYACIRRNYLGQLKWLANAWRTFAHDSSDSMESMYALINYFEIAHEVTRVEVYTVWWEVDYETLFNTKRM